MYPSFKRPSTPMALRISMDWSTRNTIPSAAKASGNDIAIISSKARAISTSSIERSIHRAPYKSGLREAPRDSPNERSIDRVTYSPLRGVERRQRPGFTTRRAPRRVTPPPPRRKAARRWPRRPFRSRSPPPPAPRRHTVTARWTVLVPAERLPEYRCGR